MERRWLAIAGVLIYGSIEFFAKHDGAWMSGGQVWERLTYFFTGGTWTAGFRDAQYGILPLLTGTLVVAVIAAFIALPVGLMTAIYLSEYAAPRARAIAKPTLELLAGIPTVVYGFFAITVITPFLAQFIDDLGNPFNMLSGGIVVGIFFAWLIIRGVSRGITGIAGRLATESDKANGSAAQVAQASQAMANGATQQASSLEETSSSLHEMASMTQRNSENAQKPSSSLK